MFPRHCYRCASSLPDLTQVGLACSVRADTQQDARRLAGCASGVLPSAPEGAGEARLCHGGGAPALHRLARPRRLGQQQLAQLLCLLYAPLNCMGTGKTGSLGSRLQSRQALAGGPCRGACQAVASGLAQGGRQDQADGACQHGAVTARNAGQARAGTQFESHPFCSHLRRHRPDGPSSAGCAGRLPGRPAHGWRHPASASSQTQPCTCRGRARRPEPRNRGCCHGRQSGTVGRRHCSLWGVVGGWGWGWGGGGGGGQRAGRQLSSAGSAWRPPPVCLWVQLVGANLASCKNSGLQPRQVGHRLAGGCGTGEPLGGPLHFQLVLGCLQGGRGAGSDVCLMPASLSDFYS